MGGLIDFLKVILVLNRFNSMLQEINTMYVNLASLLDNAVRQHRDAVALIEGERAVTYGELDSLASRVAAGLESFGIGSGDTVALSSANTIEFVASFYGVLKTGAAIMPLNFLLRSQEIKSQLEFSGAKAYICQADSGQLSCGSEGMRAFAEARSCEYLWLIGPNPNQSATTGVASFEQLVQNKACNVVAKCVSGEEVAIVSFTSGTTGNPKAVCVSHQAEYAGSFAMAATYGFVSQDILVAVVPLFTSIAQALILNPIVAMGGTLVLQPRFDPVAVLEAIARHRATVFIGVPTMLQRMAQSAPATHQLETHWRLTIYGGSALLPDIRGHFSNKFRVPIRQAYGLTETRLSAAGPPDIERCNAHDALLPIIGFTFRIVDEAMQDTPQGDIGELVFLGPGVMNGYLNNKEHNEKIFQGGWFHTGDLAIQADDGCYYLVGRIKDVISRGGYKVYPADVESILRTHPSISDSAVIGIPHPEYGEEIAAAVVLNQGVALDSASIQEWGKNALPAHMYPRVVKIVDMLPISPAGKLLRKEIAENFSHRAEEIL